MNLPWQLRGAMSRRGPAFTVHTLLRVSLIVVGLLAWEGCRKSDQPATGTEGAKAVGSGPADLNVMLISMDTTRADHLGCYGHPFIRTPNIDRLATEGATFLQCISSVPITLPSHGTMMTGTHPPVHGARDNGLFHLHADNLTLAETMREQGYTTLAQVAAYVLNREFGLNQGFDVYGDKYEVAQHPEDSKRFLTYLNAEEIRARTLETLRAYADKRFFFFAHFFDPHQPFMPPEKFLNQYADRYVSEIAYVDEQIGLLLAGMAELGLDRNTLIILTSDHGEGRGQHGEETHSSFVYDSTLSVPLIFHCPGLIPAGRRIDAQVRLVDIAPTILDIVGLEPLPDAQGVSLLPLLTGARDDLGLPAYSETLFNLYNYAFSPLRSWREGGWKYIHAPTPELYQVSVDTGELINLAAREPDRVAQMRQRLRGFIEDLPVVVGAGGSQRAMTSDNIEQLRSLGYVGGGHVNAATDAEFSELDLFEPHGPDPKDYTDLIALIARSIGLTRSDHPDAEKVVRECIAKAPNPDAGFSWAYMDLAYLLTKRGEYEEALEWYRKAEKVHPDDVRTLSAIGDALQKAGRLDEAIEMHRKALKCRPIFAQTYCGMGEALAEKGEYSEAIMYLRKALEIDPGLAYAYRILGRLYARTRQIKEAIAAWEKAVELFPDEAKWRAQLASLLVTQGDEAALDHYQELIRANPEDPKAHAGLGEVYKYLDHPEQAEESFRRALQLDPEYVAAYDALGLLLQQQGKYAEAIKVIRRGLELGPKHLQMTNNLAWLLATSPDAELRDGAEAVRLAKLSSEATKRENANFLDTLAVAYAEMGSFEQAMEVNERALKLARNTGEEALIPILESRRSLYENKQAYHER